MSPDLIIQKQRKDDARKVPRTGKNTPAFKQPLGSGKTPSFSLNLVKAAQMKQDDEESVQDLPSEVNRRIKHHKVANEAEA